MGIDYAVEELTAAVRVLAASDADLATRLQRAWDAHYQNLWTSVYLPEHLNVRFKALWKAYTAPSDDRFSTKLREMSDEELATLASEIVQLAVDTASAAARGEEPAPRPSPKGTP